MTMLVSSTTAAYNSFYTASSPSGAMGVAAALAAIKANVRTKVTISDSAANLEKNFDALSKLANNITGVTPSDPEQALNLSASQLQKGAVLLGKFSADYQLQVSDVTAANAVKLASNAHVTGISVKDSSVNVSNQLSALNNNDRLTRIDLTTPAANITLTAAQLDNLSGLWAKMGSSYGLTVSQATSAQAVTYANDLRIKSVSILDSTAGIATKLDDLKSLGLRLKEIRTTADQPALQVSAEQVSQDALVIGKIYSSYQLAVYNATAVQAQTLAANRKVVSIDVVDTVANIAGNLKLLDRIGADLNSVHITDLTDSDNAPNPLALTSSDFAAYGSVLSKIDDSSYTVALRDADVNEALTLTDDAHVTSIAVADSGASISSALDALRASDKVVSITQTGKPIALTLTAAQLSSNSAVLGKLTGSYTLNVSGVSASRALSLASTDARIASMSVSDTGSAITSKLAELSALGKKLTSVAQSDADTALSLSVNDWMANVGALSKISGGYSVALKGVSASNAEKFATDSRVRSLAVTDTSAAIAAKLGALHGLGAQLTAITQSDAGPVTVTAGQRMSYGQTLAKMGDNYTLDVRGALVKEVQSLQADSHVASIAVSDSSATIAASLDSLQDNTKLSSISFVDKGQPLALNVTQLTRDADALAKIQGNYTLALSGVSASDALNQAQNSRVRVLSVSDTAKGIVDHLDALSRVGGKLGSIRSNSALLSMSASQWQSYSGVLEKVQGGYRVNLNGVSAEQAVAVVANDRVQSLAISDSTAAIASQFTDLQALGPKITAIEQSDPTTPLAITVGQRNAAADLLAKLDSAYSLALRDVSADQAQAMVDDVHVKTIAISDTSANIAANLNALNDNSKIATLTQSGVATPLSITAAQMARNASALDKISGNYSLALSQVGADHVGTLAANTKVSSLSVSDSAANILDNLAALKAAGKKMTSMSQSGTPSVLNMSHGDWQSYQTTLDKFTAGYDVTLTDVSAASAASAATNVHVRSLGVKDSATRIASGLEALQGLGPMLSSITLTDTSNPIQLSAEQMKRNANALAKITGEVHLAVHAVKAADAQALSSQAGVDSVSVSDSSANIAKQLDALQANNKLLAITQVGAIAPLSITAAQVTANADALTKISGDYSLDVREASADQAADLQTNSHVLGFNVADASSLVGAALSTLATLNKLESVTLTADDGPISVSQTQLDSWRGTLDKIQGSYRLALTNVTTDRLAEMAADERVSDIQVNATSQQISEAFDDLVGLGTTLTGVTLTTPDIAIAISQTQWQGGEGVLAKLSDGYQLNLTEVTAQDATRLSTQAHVQGLSVLDTASNIAANFDELLALGGSVESVMLKDDADVVLSQDQFDAGSDLLAKFLGQHSIVTAS
jgi:hypothetical protein